MGFCQDQQGRAFDITQSGHYSKVERLCLVGMSGQLVDVVTDLGQLVLAFQVMLLERDRIVDAPARDGQLADILGGAVVAIFPGVGADGRQFVRVHLNVDFLGTEVAIAVRTGLAVRLFGDEVANGRLLVVVVMRPEAPIKTGS